MFLKAGFCWAEIAEAIALHKFTISQELKHNQVEKGHRPKQALRFANERQNITIVSIKPEEWKLVEDFIGLDLGLEQLSNHCRGNQIMHISH
ncbi:MAG: hypothetical protein JW866_04980 [Ignavibacteriales bacterium]|nr:hypothetical protein [Ignavibacteriales bacterium]